MEEIKFVMSKKGEKIPIINDYFLHSIYNATAEGEKLAKTFLLSYNPQKPIVVLGLGFGYHLNYLIKNKIEFIVIEPNKELINLFYENFPDSQTKIYNIIPENLKTIKDNIFILKSEFRLFPNIFNEIITKLISETKVDEISFCGTKVLIDFPIYGGSLTTAKYTEEAFKRLGCEVKIVDNTIANELLQKLLKMNQKNAILMQKLTELLSDIFWLEVKDFNPDIVFFNAQSPITAQLLEAIKKSSIPSVFWFVEDFRRFQYWQEIGRLVDKFYVIQEGDFTQELIKTNITNFSYLPMASSLKYHKELNLSTEEKNFWGSDISFMGAGYPNRHKLFEHLTDFNLKLWGTGWENNSLLGKFIAKNGERISIEESVKIYNSTKINLNLHSSLDSEIFDKYGDFINPRTFEIMACGGFQLADRRDAILKLFKEDEEIVLFSSIEELRDKIKFYLKNEDLRLKIAKNGQSKVLKYHTYEKRITKIMQDLFVSFPNLKEKIDKRKTSQDELIKEINDPLLVKFWNELNNDEKLSFNKIISKIENSNSPISRPEAMFLALKSFLNNS